MANVSRICDSPPRKGFSVFNRKALPLKGWLEKPWFMKAKKRWIPFFDIFVEYFSLILWYSSSIFVLNISVRWFCWTNSLWYFYWIFLFNISVGYFSLIFPGRRLETPPWQMIKCPISFFAQRGEYCWSHSLDVEILLNDLELCFKKYMI